MRLFQFLLIAFSLLLAFDQVVVSNVDDVPLALNEEASSEFVEVESDGSDGTSSTSDYPLIVTQCSCPRECKHQPAVERGFNVVSTRPFILFAKRGPPESI